ncbi:MAG: hypothetical protein ABDK87_04945 [Atribacterota bacterium]
MRQRWYLVFSLLVLAVYLSGCSGVTTPVISDEAQIVDLISKFCLAISDRDWNRAKSYCYPGSSWYLTVEELEEEFTFWLPGARIQMIPYIYSINIRGNEARVILALDVQIWYQGRYVSYSIGPAETLLVKIHGKWYFYY